MRSILLLSFIFSISFSCTKVHDLHKKNGIYHLKEVQAEVRELKHVSWEVGLKREITVSKGMRITIDVPVISDDTKKILYGKHGVDSWVYRVTRSRRGRTDPLAHVYYHFNNITRSTKTFTTNIYYHAASVSNRFRYFHCPAFEHRFYLPRLKLESRERAGKADIFVRAMPKVPSKVERLGFTPLIFTAGRSMLGEYKVDFALYNTKTKQRFSGWFAVGNKLNINQEIARSVPSCAGIKEENNPLPSSKPLDIRNLEIK